MSAERKTLCGVGSSKWLARPITPGPWTVEVKEANNLCPFRHFEIRAGDKRIGWILWENDAHAISALPEAVKVCETIKEDAHPLTDDQHRGFVTLLAEQALRRANSDSATDGSDIVIRDKK